MHPKLKTISVKKQLQHAEGHLSITNNPFILQLCIELTSLCESFHGPHVYQGPHVHLLRCDANQTWTVGLHYKFQLRLNTAQWASGTSWTCSSTYECSCLSVATLYYILFLSWVYVPILPGLISLGRYWQITFNTPSVFNFIAHCSCNRPHRPFSATLATESCCSDAHRYWIYVTKCCNRLISVMYICLQDTTKINSAQNT